jgi:hypothetical protein
LKDNCRWNNSAHWDSAVMKMVTLSLFTLDTCPLLDTHKVQKHGLIHTLPEQLPVMPLSGAVLFPHALLPLYIFEPRYRKMLEHALESIGCFA